MTRTAPGMRTFTILSVCLVALSGCLGTPAPKADGPDQDDPSLAPGSSSLTFQECRIQSALIAAPSEIVAGEIPDGFAPVHGDDAGATSLIGFSGTTCSDATSQEDPANHAEFRFYAFVEPPAEWQDASVDDYVLLFFVTTSDASMADHYEAWGHWVEVGDVSVASDDVATTAMGTVNAAHGSEDWDVRTAVDPASEACYDSKHVRSFAEGPDGIHGYVDVTSGPGCAWTGNAKVVLPQAPASDPMELVTWAGLNGILTGQGRHVGDEVTVTQQYTHLA